MHFKTNKYKSRKWPVIYWFSLSALFMNVHKHSRTLTNVRGHSQTFTDIYELSWTFKYVKENSWMFTNVHEHSCTFTNVLVHSRTFTYVHEHSQTFVHLYIESLPLYINKWHGVKILLWTGGQGHPTPIHTPTQVQHSNIYKNYQKRSFSTRSPWRTDGPTDQRTDGRTDGQSLL